MGSMQHGPVCDWPWPFLDILVCTRPSLASPQVTGEPMGRIVFEEARGLDGLKEAKLTIKPGEKSPFKMFEGPSGDGITLNIAVANGLGNAKKLIKVSKCCQSAVD